MRQAFVRLRSLCLVLPVLSLGCGQSLPAPADRETARQTLCTALEAWQKGEVPAALQRRSPPIFITDMDWQAGCRLRGFQLSDTDELHGVQYRCHVVLKLTDTQGKQWEKTVTYLIDTHPALVIVRGDF